MFDITDYYPHGGIDDLIGTFDTFEQAHKYGEALNQGEFFHIVDIRNPTRAFYQRSKYNKEYWIERGTREKSAHMLDFVNSSDGWRETNIKET